MVPSWGNTSAIKRKAVAALRLEGKRIVRGTLARPQLCSDYRITASDIMLRKLRAGGGWLTG